MTAVQAASAAVLNLILPTSIRAAIRTAAAGLGLRLPGALY